MIWVLVIFMVVVLIGYAFYKEVSTEDTEIYEIHTFHKYTFILHYGDNESANFENKFYYNSDLKPVNIFAEITKGKWIGFNNAIVPVSIIKYVTWTMGEGLEVPFTRQDVKFGFAEKAYSVTSMAKHLKSFPHFNSSVLVHDDLQEAIKNEGVNI